MEQKSFTVKLRIEVEKDSGTEIPKTVVHAFDATGRHLASQPFYPEKEPDLQMKLPSNAKNSQVIFIISSDVPIDMPSCVPLLAGAVEPAAVKSVAPLSHFIRTGAFLRKAMLTQESPQVNVTIPRDIAASWLKRGCAVKGRVIKRLTMPDGTTKDLGLWRACVLIYEVDKWPAIIARLPENLLYKLRESIWDFIRRPPPPPPPEDFFGSAYGHFIPAKKQDIREMTIVNPPYPINVRARMSRAESNSNEDTLQDLFTATTPKEIRAALIAYQDILVQYACLFEFIHMHYRTDFITCACTDSQGYFRKTIYYAAGGDKPDLYFKVVACVDGAPTVVYKPPVPCSTHWNYVCGSDVLLIVKDPSVQATVPQDPVDVPEGGERWILPYAIGGIPVNEFKETGLTNRMGFVNSPFGGYLGFRMGFSGSIPKIGDSYYLYRLRYKKTSESKWHDFSAPVLRHYVKELPGKLPSFPVITLGPIPIVGMNLYRFKPPKPDDGVGFVPGGTNYWPEDDWFGDIYSGFLNSTELPGGIDAAAGSYKVRVEIYDNAGVKVIPGPTTFRFLVPDGMESDGITIKARDTVPGEIIDGGFEFNIVIDNRRCTAAIDAPSIGAESAGDLCGFLRYAAADTIRIAFEASHPANHATFGFDLIRGSTGVNSASGETGTAGMAGSYTGDGAGHFSREFTPGSVLHPCIQAGFAEHLHVYAKATDGWRVLEEYNAHAVRGFALAPKSVDA